MNRTPLLLAALLFACDGGGTTTDAGPPAEMFVVDFDTSAGPIAVEVHPEWAPLGAARFRELVEMGFYDDTRFFRVVPGFVAQFGLSGDPAVNAAWQSNRIADDPVVASNTRGRVTFATAGPGTRTTQLFLNYGDNAGLDPMGFAPFGEVIEGMENADAIEAEYGEMPQQPRIQSEGNAYLDAEFPNLTAIRSASVR
ncbi:MAG: peptidylprolyl isomerase [Sandaracinaceae bacterium]